MSHLADAWKIAPPSYTPPTPGFSTTIYSPLSPISPSSIYSQDQNNAFHNNPYNINFPVSNHQIHPHIWRAPPQELPVRTPSTLATRQDIKTHKFIYGNPRGPSELPGDDIRSELDSRRAAEFESPVLGRLGLWKGDGRGGGGRHDQTKRSRNGGHENENTASQTWMPPEGWASQDLHMNAHPSRQARRVKRESRGEAVSAMQSLGVLDVVDEEVEVEVRGGGRVGGRSAERREDKGRRYNCEA